MSRGKFHPYQDPNGRPQGFARAGGRPITVLIYLVAAVALVASLPVDGIAGVGLAVIGIAAVWLGWARVVQAGRDRRTQQGIDQALRGLNAE